MGDEWAANRVDVDPAGFPALVVAALFVEVAEWGAADGAAGAGFLAEAFDDFAGEVAGVELGDGAHDAVEEYAAGGLVDVLGGGDEAGAGLVEDAVDVDVVGAVAGEAVEFVDDDVVDVAGVLEVVEHLLQLGAIGAAGRFAAVDELFDDESAQGHGLFLVGFALGGDGEALGSAASLGLFTGGDPQVGDGPLRGE